MKNTLTNNPLQQIERTLGDFLNITPLFHSLDEIYRTGDQVRFSQSENSLEIQVDLPGCKRGDLEISTDANYRDVYVKARREIKNHDGKRVQEYNRSFSIGREFDLDQIKFNYEDGVLEVSVPRRKKEEHIRKYTL